MCTPSSGGPSSAPFLPALVSDCDRRFPTFAGVLSSVRSGIRLGLHPIRRAWAWPVQLSWWLGCDLALPKLRTCRRADILAAANRSDTAFISPSLSLFLLLLAADCYAEHCGAQHLLVSNEDCASTYIWTAFLLVSQRT